MKHIYIVLIILANIVIFYSNTQTLSISYKEANIIFNANSFIHYYSNAIIYFFGKDDFF